MAHINPFVQIGNYSEGFSQYYQIKRFYSLINFKNGKIFTYGIGEEDLTTLEPAEAESFYFWSCGSSLNWTSGGSPVNFITNAAWGDYGAPGIVNSPSGFVTPASQVGSVMPKLMIPSTGLVDNGIDIGTDAGQFGERRGVFNWKITHVNGVPFTPANDADVLNYLQSSGEEGAKFVSIKYKDDDSSTTSIKLNCKTNPERSTALQAYTPTPSSLVGHGACLIMINVHPLNIGRSQTGDTQGNDNWRINIEFPTGELKISFDNTGSMLVDIGGNITKTQLTQSMSKEKPPQYQQVSKKGPTPYCLAIYPVWNGIIISDGIQDANGSSTGQYCVKNKNAHVTNLEYFGQPFKPYDVLGPPENLWGGGGGSPATGGVSGTNDLNFYISSPNDVSVNFGTNLNAGLDIEFIGCRADIAYLPLFHLDVVQFDYYYLSGIDNSQVRYWQWAYPIWTDNNNGTFTMDEYNVEPTYQNPDAGTDSEFRRIEFLGKTNSNYYDRYGGEIFGFYFQSDENRSVNVNNEDGAYPLNSFWTSPVGNISGDPNPLSGWFNYIENLNVTIGLDGSNGSITIDKYGIAGQRAVPIQNIGSIQITAFGNYTNNFDEQWNGSHPPTDFDKPSNTANILFTGIGMGAGQSESSDGATFTIPLEGRYKKLEDIILINAPFFDGYPLGEVIIYLCKYGGLSFDVNEQYHGNLTTGYNEKIKSSESIDSPIVDFKAGTSILDALNQLCDLTHHSFYIKRDGKIHFYQLGVNGFPVELGYDWGAVYGSSGYSIRMNNRDVTPDFSDLRNEIVGIAQQATSASGSDIKNIPLFPLIALKSNPTVPTVPWSKGYLFPVNGVLSQSELEEIIQNQAYLSRKYLLTGSITVPGNPYIEPYDQWTIEGVVYVVESVSHSMDFGSKTWTTQVTLFGA